MDISKNRGGPPKWMVKIMEKPIKMDDLGVPLFLETPISHWFSERFSNLGTSGCASQVVRLVGTGRVVQKCHGNRGINVS